MLHFPVCHWSGGGDLVKNIYKTHGWRSSALAGVSDGKVGTMALWGKISSDGVLYTAVNGGGKTQVLAIISFGGTPSRLEMKNANLGVGKVINADGTANTHLAGYDVWAWYGFSWNSGAGRASMYLNDTDVQDHGSFLSRDDTAEYSSANHRVYANAGGVANPRGCFKHFYLSFSVEYDFSVEANRRLFIDGAGRPVMPPSGDVVLLKGDPSDNSGSGGDFTIVNGPFEFCDSAP